MSTFHVGQRVRIIGCEPGDLSQNVGKQAIVNEIDAETIDDTSGPWVGVTVDGDPDWCERPWHLVPIQPEAGLVSDCEALWQPTPERAAA